METTIELFRDALRIKLLNDPDGETVIMRMTGDAAKRLLKELDCILNKEDDGK